MLRPPKASLPKGDVEGAHVVVIAGSAYAVTSPVKTSSSMFYVDARLAAGKSLHLPDEHEERAFYVIRGVVGCAGRRCQRATW